MKFLKRIPVVSLALILSTILLPAVLTRTAAAQTKDLHIALQRGFRTGYSDGYMAGYRDKIDNLAKNYGRHDDYARADRGFISDYGTVEDYRDGYRQGFEGGYDTGYEKRTFESTLPTDIKRRGAIPTGTPAVSTIPDSSVAGNRNAIIPANPDDQIQATTQNDTKGPLVESNAVILIPRETELMIELQEDLSTDRSRTGDKFTAKVVSPSELDGAIIEGRISKITQPGRIRRKSELALSFDRIILSDTRWSNFSAMLIEVMPVKGDNIRLVDAEGTAVGQSSMKGDAIKVGSATGTGLVVGALVGGPVGAAVGAGMGAAFGVGAVVIERGKHIRLNHHQQLRIKTACESRIR